MEQSFGLKGVLLSMHYIKYFLMVFLGILLSCTRLESMEGEEENSKRKMRRHRNDGPDPLVLLATCILFITFSMLKYARLSLCSVPVQDLNN